MIDNELESKLNPKRYPNMSPKMAAILGYLIEKEYTTPLIVRVQITTDKSVYVRTENEPHKDLLLGDVYSLKDNFRRLFKTAGVSEDENYELEILFKNRFGVELNEHYEC